MKAAGLVTLLGLASTSSGATQPQRETQRGDRSLRADNFTVAIDEVEVPGWREVQLPSSSTEEGEYGGGDDERKTWGQTTFDDLEMERGVQPGDTRIVDWREAVRMGNVDEGRKEIAVVLMDQRGEPQIRWEFTGAWIKEYDPPELDASADGDVATESITVAFDRMVREEV